MIKIIAILQEKLEEQKLKNKVNRVRNCIQAARLQAETDLMEISDRRIKTVESLKERETSDVMTELLSLRKQENAINEQLLYLEQEEKFLFEEVQQKK